MSNQPATSAMKQHQITPQAYLIEKLFAQLKQ